MHEALRHRLLGKWSDLVTGRPVLTLTLAFAFAAASIALAATRLGFNSNRNDLIDKDIPWNQRFIDWQTHFPGSYDLYVIIDSWGDGERQTPESLATARRIADQLGERLKADPLVKDVVWGFDPRRVHPRAMRLLAMEPFERQLQQVVEAGRLLDRPDFWIVLGEAMRPPAEADSDAVRAMRDLIQLSQRRWEYLATPNGRLLVMRITPRGKTESISAMGGSIASIRATLADVLASNPGGVAGLTGIEVVEADETAAATTDSTIASIIAVVLIAAVLIAAFHSVRTPLLIVTALLVGVAWTFGFLTLAIGYLQVISVVFTVMLLGLGVAFGIHLAARFELVRHDHVSGGPGFVTTMRDTLQTVGPGIITGAVTTAAAFCTTLVTEFTGVAEMGLIAGVGILLCLLAMFSVFPALMRLVKPGRRHIVHLDQRWFHFYDDRWFMPAARRPWLTLGLWLIVAGASLAAASRMHFDYNLTNLLPRGIDSVTWQQRLTRDGDQSIFFGISVATSHDDARRRVEAFRAAAARPDATLGGVMGYGLLFPEHEDAKLQLTHAARAEVGPALERVAATGDGIRREIARNLLKVLDPAPLTEADLPAEIMRSYVAEDAQGRRRIALEVFPQLPPGIDSPLDPRFLPRFVADLQRVDPAVTGVVTQIYFSGDLIKRAYLIAGVLALAAVFCLVVLDFQSVTDALLAILPVAVGFAVTFGVLWLVGEQINPANVIVLPLMFGIGVDFGVHMLHRYRVDDATRPLGLSAGTGKGIALTALTTIIGFGAMLVARHRGIASLGFVLALGVALTLLACLTLMPALLELRSRRRQSVLKHSAELARAEGGNALETTDEHG